MILRLLPTHDPRISRRNRARQRRGATLVEFAVVSPIVFLLFFASFEFCRVAMIQHTADNAVYEGARVAMLPGGTATEARNQAAFILQTLGVNNVAISVTPSQIRSDTPEITVGVRIPIDGNSFVPSRFFAGHVIERELTMTRELVR